MTEEQRAIFELCRLEVFKVVFSVPHKKAQEVKKCTARLIENKDEYQLERLTEKQAFHENTPKSNLCDKVTEILETQFRQAEIFTPEYIYSVRLTNKGKLLQNRRKNDTQVFAVSHNRKKNYIIDLENAPPVLYDLGIIGRDGKIINTKYDKFRQICRFTELINDVVSKDERQEYNIVDFGCGKSYLTFVVYHYMTVIMGKKVNICGLDLKQDVIDHCNELAKKYGYTELAFYCRDIKDYKPSVRPDMVIALHACDIATDLALYNAYLWQADYIFSVPCCQHEFGFAIKTENFSLLSDYGIIKERFCALATDALRAKMLEYCGYDVDVLEFIDIEHSPKNILIRAKRTTRSTQDKRKHIRREIDGFTNEFNAVLTFEKLVLSDETEYASKGETFTVVCGRSSMLIKDAMTVRRRVFGDEQNYTGGAMRDDADETAVLVNVYHSGRVCATSRSVYTEKSGVRLFGKIAVDKDYRSFGLGKAMLERLEKAAACDEASEITINAQSHAVGFYQKLGFSESAEHYIEEGIEMIPVSKKLK